MKVSRISGGWQSHIDIYLFTFWHIFFFFSGFNGIVTWSVTKKIWSFSRSLDPGASFENRIEEIKFKHKCSRKETKSREKNLLLCKNELNFIAWVCRTKSHMIWLARHVEVSSQSRRWLTFLLRVAMLTVFMNDAFTHFPSHRHIYISDHKKLRVKLKWIPTLYLFANLLAMNNLLDSSFMYLSWSGKVSWNHSKSLWR